MLVRKQATLDRFEGKQAILLIDGGQELRLLRDDMGEVQPGQTFVIQILPEAEAALERDELARTLLNQIINNESPSNL
jgi:hypothetical protein